MPHLSACLQVLTGEQSGGKDLSSYFASKYCVMEYRGALSAGKPIIFILETDPSHGGVPLSAHIDEMTTAMGDHCKL